MNYNYHTHTYRCNHATGTPEEYIKIALKNGIKYMGFSDHIPFIYDDGYEAKWRVPFSEGRDYINEILDLKEKYSGEIEIKVGFEMEYFPTHFEKMLKTAREFGAEYLIMGPHYVGSEFPNCRHVTNPSKSVERLEAYADTIIAAMKTGVFSYIAHPDMFNFTGNDDDYIKSAEKICKASKKLGVPIELNLLGIREKRCYPNLLFWKVAGKIKPPVTFGLDSHRAQDAFDRDSLIIAKQMVEKFSLNYIGKPQIIAV